MKPYLTTFFLFFLFVFPFSAYAQDTIRFDESGLELVMQRAKVEKIIILPMLMGVHIETISK
jgi:hypothetical protein